MADKAKPREEAKPPAESGGLTLEQVNQAIAEVMKPVAETLKALGDGQKQLAERFDAKAPAAEVVAADAKKDDKPAKAEPLTAESVAKLIADGIAADRKAQGDAAAKKSARDALLAKVVKEKLGGDAEYADYLTGETEDDLNRQADKLAAKLQKIRPDFGGGSKDGGKLPNDPAGAPKPIAAGNLSKGASTFAASIKLPE